MTLEISGIVAAADPENERVVLRVLNGVDIGRYAIFRCRPGKTPTSVQAAGIPNAYWFLDKQVAKDDLVVLYTKKGTRSEKKLDNGSTSHFFYWGLSQPIWVPNMVPVLISIATWRIGESLKNATLETPGSAPVSD